MKKTKIEKKTLIVAHAKGPRPLTEWASPYISGHPNFTVKAFTLYFSRLHPDRNDFWQRPRKSGQVKESDDIWYEDAPIGKNTLGNLMAKISEDCGLSRKYTSHCIRCTCITVLDEGGVETRHIIGLNSHKSESPVK